MNQGFRRARSPENKEIRRRSILDAAAVVLDRDGWAGASLTGICAEAGIAKSALYRYFDSREEVLLRLMLADLEALVEGFEPEVRPGAGIDALARATAGAFIARPRLCLLISRAASVLEENIAFETLLPIKRALSECAGRAALALSAAHPGLPPDRAGEVLQMLYVQIAGLWPLADPNETVNAVLEEIELSHLRLEFGPALTNAALLMFRGAVQAAER